MKKKEENYKLNILNNELIKEKQEKKRINELNEYQSYIEQIIHIHKK